MGKVTKIVADVLSWILLVVVGLLLAVMLLLDVGFIQTTLSKHASLFASNFLGTTVSVKSINLTGYNRLSVRDFYVEDFSGDTLLFVQRASVRLSLAHLLKGEVSLSGVKADGAKLFLHDSGDGKVNIAQITDLLIPKNHSSNPKPITLHNLCLTNSEFRLVNDERKEVEAGLIDWGNMRFEHLNAKADFLTVTGSRVEMELHDINFTDRTGAVFNDVAVGNFAIDSGLLEFTDARIQMQSTDLHIPLIRLASENGWSEWKSYTDSVTMDIRLTKSVAGAGDLSYFVPFIKREQTFVLRDITATFSGITDNFGGVISNVLVYGTRFEGRYHVVNAVSKPIGFDGEITKLNTYSGDIEALAKQFGVNMSTAQLAMLSRAGKISLSVKADGKLDAFSVKSDIHTDLGVLTAQAGLGIRRGTIALDNAAASSKGFDVGYLLNNKKLGGVGFSAIGDMQHIVADIDEIKYGGYTYHNISANGSFADNRLSAKIVSDDYNADFVLNGTYTLNDIPSYSADVFVKRIDLNALGFNRNDSVSVLSTTATLSGKGISLDDLYAHATFTDTRYQYSGGIYSTKTVSLMASNTSGEHNLMVVSEPLTAKYSSSADYRSSFGYLKDILYVFLPALPVDDSVAPQNRPKQEQDNPIQTTPSYISIRFDDVNPLLRAVVPGLSVAKGTNLALNYDPVERNLLMTMESSSIEFKKAETDEPMCINNFAVRGWSNGISDSLHLVLNSGMAQLAGLKINKIYSTVTALNNHAEIHVTASSDQMSMATNLNGVIDLGRAANGELTVRGQIAPSTFSMDNNTWSIISKQLDFLPDKIGIEELKAISLSGHLYVDGALTNDNSDALSFDVTNFDIAPFAKLLKIDNLNIDGVLNGVAKIFSLTGGQLMEADMTLENFNVNGYKAIPLAIILRSDAKQRRNRLSITTQDGTKEFVRGHLRSSDGEYMVRGGVHGIPFGIAAAFMGNAVKNPNGEIDLDFDVTSHNKLPIISGKAVMRSITAGISFNNVAYSIKSAILDIDKNVAALSSTVITDEQGRTAELTAKADFTNFANLTYSAKFQANNLSVLNTTFAQNPTFYGKLFVTGSVDVSGDLKGMNVNAIAETNNNSSFHLPMTGSNAVVNSDFVVFESRRSREQEQADTNNGGKKRQSDSRKQKLNINVAMTLTVRPNTEINLVLDPSTNDGIRATGDAVLALRLGTRNDLFTLNGVYEIAEGDYTLSVQGITSRTFAIQTGSTIRWSDVPLDPQLDIRAVYSLRTSLSPLKELLTSSVASGGGATPSYSARVPVDCIVNIGNRLTAPSVMPDIKVRTSDPQMEAEIENALAVQDVKLTQFAWLVAFGEFFTGGNVTNEAVNLTDVGLATAAAAGSGMITGELNKLVNSDEGFSFNFDYHPRSESTSTEVIFGVTKRLTDRLTFQLNGDFDTGDNPTNSSASNVREGTLIPDASLTLDLSTRFRGQLFYRPIDQYNYNVDKGTGEFGAGISYHIDFNSFRELFARIRNKKTNK